MNTASRLRKEVLELLTRVPTPPGENIPAGASEAEIVAFEKRTGLKVPSQLQSWLLACNGPCVGPGGVFGIKPSREDLDIEELLRLHPTWVDDGWIPVAGDGCGNYYLVASTGRFGDGEPIIFVDTMEDDSAPVYVAASSTWQFLRFLFKKELGQSNWPYGHHEVTTDDPEIESVHSVPLPWNA